MCLLKKPTADVFSAPWPNGPTQHASLTALVGVGDRTAWGSKRRSVWELNTNAHCHVMGVCVPMADLKRLMHKVGIDAQGRDGYELHLIAVSECRRRSALAEAVQRELEQRFAQALSNVRSCKTSAALEAYWQEAAQQPDWAGPLWAVLTHPRCTTVLESEVLGQVHMLQHQVGMATRVDNQRWHSLTAELARTRAEVLALQQRLHEQVKQATQRLAEQALALQQQREDCATERSRHERTQTALDALQRSVPALAERQQLHALNGQLAQRVEALKRALRRREAVPTAQAVPLQPVATDAQDAVAGAPCPMLCATPCAGEPRGWKERKVVCVGGRAAQVPAYRAVVETRGAQFLYHDGGEEDNLNKLPGTLAAADLVICQVGCISHNAYWRVKEHCKRTGTPCAFVDSPSKSALERALRALEADQG